MSPRVDSPRGWDLNCAPNSSGTSPAGNSKNRKDTPELTQSQEIWLPCQTSSSCQDKCVMVKKPAVLWLFPAGAVAGWAKTRGAQGLCWASLAHDQKHTPSPILSSGIQNCMALQTRSFISSYKPSTTLLVVMLTRGFICHSAGCIPPCHHSPQSHTREFLLLPRYKKHLFGVGTLLGIISVQTEALNKSMHPWGYIFKGWGKPSGGAILSADIRVGRERSASCPRPV